MEGLEIESLGRKCQHSEEGTLMSEVRHVEGTICLATIQTDSKLHKHSFS